MFINSEMYGFSASSHLRISIIPLLKLKLLILLRYLRPIGDLPAFLPSKPYMLDFNYARQAENMHRGAEVLSEATKVRGGIDENYNIK